MIRSVYEYNHREWLEKREQYNFAGMPITELTLEQAQAALAFMVQYAGDLKNHVTALRDLAMEESERYG